jgi:nucleoside-diphosphate-sugar epimerase
MKSYKVTILGGSGFVGTNLCRELSKKQQDFEIIDLKLSKQFPNKSKIGDVRDIQSLRNTITGNLIINLAAVHRDDIDDKDAYFNTNVIGADNIAKVCAEFGIKKIVFTSSVAVYGFADPGTSEIDQIRPFNEYGKTKFAAEEIFRDWQKSGDNSLIIVRPTVIFGEGNRGNVYNLFRHIASGSFVMIGSGKNKKSIAFIGNVVAFLETCMTARKRYAVYNYVDSPDMTMNELVSLVRRKLKNKDNVGLRVPYMLGISFGYFCDFIAMILKKKLSVSSIRVKKFCSSSEFRSAKNELESFSPPYDLEEAIDLTLRSEFILQDPNREIFYSE